MKKLFFLFFIPITFSCNPDTVSYITGSKTDIGGILNGKVKSYSIKTFNAKSKFGKPVKGTEKEQTFLIETKTHIYNENGDLKERYTTDGYKIIFDFDDKGIVKGYSYYDNNDNLITVRSYESDAQGNIIKSSSYDLEGNLNYYTRNLYNEKGENYESIQYDDKGDLSRKTERIYDDYGNLIKRLEYGKDGKISSEYNFTYDSISAKKINQKLFKSKTNLNQIYSDELYELYDFFREYIRHPKPTGKPYSEMNPNDFRNLFYTGKTSITNRKKIYDLIVKWNKKYLALIEKPPIKIGPWEEGLVDAIFSNRFNNGYTSIKSWDGKQYGYQLDKSERAIPLSKLPYFIKQYDGSSYRVWSKRVFPQTITKTTLVLEDEITYDYNDKGDLILENKNDKLKEYKYEYDENGNWVIKYEYLYGKIKYLTERNIQYFK